MYDLATDYLLRMSVAQEAPPTHTHARRGGTRKSLPVPSTGTSGTYEVLPTRVPDPCCPWDQTGVVTLTALDRAGPSP